MTTALSAPSEEERRLLREYRLVSVPSRRSSCSPATSNASSSTNPTSLLGDQLLQAPPQIVTVLATPVNHPSSGNNKSNGGVSNGKASPKISPKALSTQANTNHHQHVTSQTNGTSHQNNINKDSNKTSANLTNGNFGINHNHNHQKHPKHHHANNGQGHKKLRIANQTHELTAEEFKRMLELVSDLSYLKLVSMKSTATKSATTTNTNGTSSTGTSTHSASQCNGKVINQMYSDKECHNQSENRLEQLETSGSHVLETLKPGVYLGSPLSTSNSSTQCIPYIFEKVDYIKKISARRKALKKFKKARKKSRSIILPSATESRGLKV